MIIQDFFSCVYYSHRRILDRLATIDTIEAIKKHDWSSKKQVNLLMEKGLSDIASIEVNFIRTRSALFANFGINIAKFIDNPNPLDKAIEQLKIYAIKKGSFYEQSFMLAQCLGVFVQTQSQIRRSAKISDKITSAEVLALLPKSWPSGYEALFIDRIRSLIPVLTGANSKVLSAEFNLMISEPDKYSSAEYDFFVNKVCSSLIAQPSNEISKKLATHSLKMSMQCPHCGGSYFETVSKEENIKTREQFDDVRFGSEETWNGAWIVAGGAIISMVGIGIMNTLDFYSDGIIIELLKLLGGGVLTLYGGWAVLKAFQKRFQHIRSFNNNETIKHYYHTCWICGYKWNRRADEPLPEVSVRPDLIAKGEQRLREEARQAENANNAAQDILWRRPWDKK